MPTSIVEHDMGLSTMVGKSNRDAAGGPLTGQMRSDVERLRKWDRRSQLSAPGERNLNRAFAELRRYSEKVAVSEEVVERAAYIYRKALERGLIRGRSITLMTGAALYAAIRDMEIPRTLKDIAAASNVSKKDLARSYRLLLNELDLKMPIADASRSVSKIASKAGLSERTKRRAQEILARARQHEISAGKDPMGLAASALYVASVLEGEEKTQKEIAAAAAVTEVTIRNRYKGLTTALGIQV
jgi:transcription initiation factor TFIIB